jgi:hypothetical protein
MKILQKKKSFAFGKDIYYLGQDKEGINYWLEGASWDCDWYWGFGYIETYNYNSNPQHSTDIQNHEHADNFLSEFFIEFNGSKPKLINRTFTEKEGWELSELFKQYYLLKDMAEYFKNGKANCADTKIPKYLKPELVKEINEVRLPIIFNRVYKILTPILCLFFLINKLLCYI